ncbi:MAG: KOW domain-containing RNA-binding protein [Clostridia bacterium]|nr:KOW domain-containing RNA-binding protein [Clostridia bacterium]
MLLSRGLVVISKSGHDKNDLFVVLNFNGKNAIICDGKRRKLEKPKTKNEKHLILTNNKLNEVAMQSDSSIRKALNALKKNLQS